MSYIYVVFDAYYGQQRCAMKTNMGRDHKWVEPIREIFTFSVLPCAKDNDELFMKNICEPIDEGLRALCKASNVLVNRGDYNPLSLNLTTPIEIERNDLLSQPDFVTLIPINNICTARDLKFYSSTLGKVSASVWCPYCSNLYEVQP